MKRAGNKFAWGLSVVLGLVFLAQGTSKIPRRDSRALGQPVRTLGLSKRVPVGRRSHRNRWRSCIMLPSYQETGGCFSHCCYGGRDPDPRDARRNSACNYSTHPERNAVVIASRPADASY